MFSGFGREFAQHFAVLVIAMAIFSALFACTQAFAGEPDAIARQIGLEMLRDHMRSIDWTPPGYFQIGFTVRVG